MPSVHKKNLEAVFNGLRDGVFIHSLDGTILDVNAEAMNLFRVSKEQVIGRNIATDFFRPRNPLKKLAEIRTKLANGESISFQWVARRPGDASLFPVEILIKMIQWDDQDVILTTTRDITRRKRTKVLLKRRRRQLAMILDGTPIATFVIDRNHHVIFWNRACEVLTGVSGSRVLGKPVDSSIFYSGPPRPVLANLVLDMDLERIHQFYRNKNLSVSPTIPDAYEASGPLTIQGKTRDFYFLAARCKNAEGEVVAAIETIQDITERVEAEKALQCSKKLLSEVTANIPGLVYQYRFSPVEGGGFTFISKGMQAMFRLDPHHVMASQDLFFSKLQTHVSERFLNFLQCPAPPERLVEFEFLLPRDNASQWFKNSALADVRGPNEILWNGMLTDVSENKRLELMRADVERMVRHDLKSPLMGIGGLSKLLLKEELPPRQREFVDAIYHSSIKLVHMINHSMVMFKMEEGTYTLEPVEFDLAKMLRALHEEFLPSAIGKSLEFEHLLNGLPLSREDALPIQGEPILLESLFVNLIQNAVEAAPEGSRITISTSSNEHVHEVDIHNLGAIPETIRNNFFGRYVTCGKQYGTGIGTYSAMLIAKTHQGDIRFTTSEEDGTHLIVTLPRSFSATSQSTAE